VWRIIYLFSGKEKREREKERKKEEKNVDQDGGSLYNTL